MVTKVEQNEQVEDIDMMTLAKDQPTSTHSNKGFNDADSEFKDPDLMCTLHPVVLQTELRYKEECKASGVEYKEPKCNETKWQRCARRRKMKYSMDPTLRIKQRIKDRLRATKAASSSPVIHQETELRYKAQCEAKGIK